jgi:NADPH2:quinone reductase
MTDHGIPVDHIDLFRSSGHDGDMTEIASTGLQLRSLVEADGTLRLSLESVDVPAPRDGQVVVRVDAAPINPSDLGLLFGGADMAAATFTGSGEASTVTAPISPDVLRPLAGRIGDSLPVGNEGAGTVVAAGSSAPAQALLGKTVGLLGGAMYSQYRCVDVSQCLELPAGVTAAQGASCFVNPLTVLGQVGTMRREGHTALVHTAAASNLGQMLNRLCLADGIALVNIVRSSEQEQVLRSAGAKYVCNSTAVSFTDDLTAALTATGATIAFDAIGGGRLAGQILSCMEAALVASAAEYSRYGSTTHKQVYIYGGLDRGPTELNRNFGMAWSIGGWLLTPYLAKVGPEEVQRMRQRVAAEITTTFASTYTRQISLVEALSPEALAGYAKQATGEKYLVAPNA